MRGTFIKTLTELAATDERIVLLTADLGFMAIESFSERFPERFFNVGVAEQNMVGLATGLAEAGLIPFIYSIVPFAVLRPYEFIRNGPLQHRLPVRIVGVGAGLDYSTNGLSHYAVDDIGVMRVQPNLRIIAPADAEQTHHALLATWNLPETIYYRLGKDDRIRIAGLNGRFALDQVELVSRGENAKILLLATGSIATEMLQASRLLAQMNIQCDTGVLATLNPPPTKALSELLGAYDRVCTIEAHYLSGGLGSLICEVIAEHHLQCKILRFGIREIDSITGSLDFMYRKHGLSAEQIAQKVKKFIAA